MTGPRLAWLAALGLPLLGLHLISVTLTRALRNYSRSRLEAYCDRKGRPGLADDIAHEDEATERASEMLAVATGLMLAALLGVTVGPLAPSLAVESVVAIALLVGSAGYVFAGVTGRVFAEPVLDALWPVASSLRLVLWPFTTVYRSVERLVERLAEPADGAPRPSSVEIELPADEARDDNDIEPDLPESTRDLLKRAVALTRRDVSEVMTPRRRVVWLPATVSSTDAARSFRETGRSRVPLFGENHDDVVGVLYAKDLFFALTDDPVHEAVSPRKLARPPYFVPETINAYELLEEFRRRRSQLAVVLDEYGGVAGVASLEDLLEELVGEIDDEHDEPTPENKFVPLGGARYEVDASLTVEDLNDRLGLRLATDEGYTTVGGLAFTAIGRVPEAGETFRAEGVEFRVVEVAGHSIRRLALDLQPASAVGGP